MLNLRMPKWQTDDSGGGDAPSWIAQAPDEYKEDGELKEFGTIGALIKGFKGRGDELGKIEKMPEKYEFDKHEVPEGIEYNLETAQTEFAKQATQWGLNNTQAKAIFQDIFSDTIESLQSDQQSRKDATAEAAAKADTCKEALREKWGEDKYDGEMELVRRAIKTFAPTDFAAALDESGYGNDPRMAFFLNSVGHAIGEDRLVVGDIPTGSKGVDADGNFESEEAFDAELERLYPTTPKTGGNQDALDEARKEDAAWKPGDDMKEI